MQYLCLMGNNDTYTANINKKLIKLGYHDNPLWSTRKTETTEVLPESNFEDAVKDNKIIHINTKDDIKYGILRPVGYKKYTTHVSTDQFDVLKGIYGDNMEGLYISYSENGVTSIIRSKDAQILQKYGCAIILCNQSSDSNNIVAEILRLTK